ncbi:MAG TPA: hypothetical protein VKO63_10360, partial [Chitinispirillaceae bacterium]|nr:hypothetical protein [Chitinispirillaceae bacterium]
VTYYLNSFSRPEPAAYVDAMLETYYRDISDQIDNMNDEDNDLQVFRPSITMNRHYRCVCGNAAYKVADGYIEFQMDPIYRDKGKYPLDYYILYNQILHIIPVEALIDDRLILTELHRWQARHNKKENSNDN